MRLYKVGRALFGGYFLYNGINHLVNKRQLSKYARSKKVPKPDAAVVASGLALIAGGTSLILGVKPKIGAAAIVGFLATVSPTIHSFWKDRDAGEKTHNTVDFSKNLALLSGALAVAGADGAEK